MFAGAYAHNSLFVSSLDLHYQEKGWKRHEVVVTRKLGSLKSCYFGDSYTPITK